jgi:hypothetical protein
MSRALSATEQLEARLCLAEVEFDSHNVTTGFDKASDVYTADLDGDGDLDALVASSYFGPNVAWFPNSDGKGRFGSARNITSTAYGALSVEAGDLDGDGDLDVLSASYYGDHDKVAWYQNTDGKGKFGSQKVIETKNADFMSAHAVDLDGDNDLDIATASRLDDTIAWYENTDGQGTFGDQQVISIKADGARAVYSADIDGDGDQDVLSASASDNEIAWYENTNGQGTFGDQRIISSKAEGVRSVHTADIDKDGDVDVLSASFSDGKIAWYENSDGKGTFGTEDVIATLEEASSVHAADLDGDGDMDVVACTYSYENGKVVWYENSDGQGSFGNEVEITTEVAGAMSVHTADVDGDGSPDVLSASYQDDKVAWYENLSEAPTRPIGDANGDGVFNSSDLVAVFVAGEYEDGVPQNSTFEEGDWNGDQEFDTKDLVAAFQAGTYSNAARAAVADIGSAITIDTERFRAEARQEEVSPGTVEDSSQATLAARRWRLSDVQRIDRVFAEHGSSRERLDPALSHAFLDSVSGLSEESIL